jgi:23S rRNA (cytidine2498-2'-O)-methyltransferase
MIVLVAHCRAGFEPEAAADLGRIAATANVTLDAPPGRGYAVATLAGSATASLISTLDRAAPIFARSLFAGLGPFRLFDAGRFTGRDRPDRVAALTSLLSPLTRALPRPWRPPYGEVRVEMPDTNDGKALSGLARAVAAPLAETLQTSGLMPAADAPGAESRPTLHVLLADGATAFLGASVAPWRSRWPMGIPRLRMPHGAPSRSTLKLAEAFVTFLGDREPQLLRAGMRAVDLGAAPGGWTWQLAHRGLKVTAVDNGTLKGEVAGDDLVTHLRVDGLTFVPKRPVDWLVCDIAEGPARIAALVARWIGNGHARRAIFNLKLPMKKRYEETMRCRQIIDDALRQAPGRYRISLRQLYHDREEVTGFVERIA